MKAEIHHNINIFTEEETESGFFLTEHPRKKLKTPTKLSQSPRDGGKSPSPRPLHQASGDQQVATLSQSLPDEEADKKKKKEDKEKMEKHQWDEYLLSILSRPTAQWIVTQRTDPGDRRYKVRADDCAV